MSESQAFTTWPRADLTERLAAAADLLRSEVVTNTTSEDSGCPFLDANDDRCHRRLTLEQLTFAMTVCADDYASCGLYRVLNAARDYRKLARPA